MANVKDLIKKNIFEKCSVTVINKTIYFDVTSKLPIEYIVISKKRYKGKNGKFVLPYNDEIIRLIERKKVTFVVKIMKKLVAFRLPEIDINYLGETISWKEKKYNTSIESAINITEFECFENKIIFKFSLISLKLEESNDVNVIMFHGNKAKQLYSESQVVVIDNVSELIDDEGIDIYFLLGDYSLQVIGEEKNECEYNLVFMEGKMRIEKNEHKKYVFIDRELLKNIPPISPNLKTIENVKFDKSKKEFHILPKKKYEKCRIKIYMETLGGFDRVDIYEGVLNGDLYIDSRTFLDFDIDMMKRYFIKFEISKGKNIIEENYLKLYFPKRRLLEEDIIIENDVNCISFLNRAYLLVQNKGNYLLYDRKYDFDIRNESYETDFNVVSFENLKINMDLKIASSISKIDRVVIYAVDNYLKSSFLIFEDDLNIQESSYCKRIEIDLKEIAKHFYYNMRLIFKVGVVFENGYKETGFLKMKKGLYSVEERQIADCIDNDNIISLYIGANEFNLCLWYTSSEELEKSIRFQKGRETYVSTMDNEPVDDKLIFFEANLGKDYAGNPKYLYEYMIENAKFKKMKYVWAYPDEKKCEIPGDAIIVQRGSEEYFFYLAKAKYWINNILFPVKDHRDEVVYLNTWHGTPLKKLGFDIDLDGPEKRSFDNLYKESLNWDYLLVDNDYGEEKLVGAFHFKKNIIKKGYPINDIFFDEKKKGKIRNKILLKYPAIEGKKIILYAPTWRDLEGDYVNGYDFNLPFELERLYSEISDKAVIMVKLHHLIADNLVIDDKYKDFIINASHEEDIMELLCVTDILITDYSSVFYDFTGTRNPILFYMYDAEEYINKTRGLYVDINTLPGPIVRDTEEIIECIKNIFCGNFTYDKKLNMFCDEMNKYRKGTSCKDVLDIVICKEDLE